MNRFKAFGIHFLISLAIFIGLVILIFTYWFPGILADADSSWERMLLVIAGVDLVLGPTLTLIVFNPEKKSLKFDLGTIAVLQFAVLSYGVFTIHTTRPLALYLSIPQIGFEVMYADKVSDPVKKYLHENEAQVFFYNTSSGAGRYGPRSIEQLTPDNLLPVTADQSTAFVQFAEENGVSFSNDGMAAFHLVATGKTIEIDKQGQLQH